MPSKASRHRLIWAVKGPTSSAPQHAHTLSQTHAHICSHLNNRVRKRAYKNHAHMPLQNHVELGVARRVALAQDHVLPRRQGISPLSVSASPTRIQTCGHARPGSSAQRTDRMQKNSCGGYLASGAFTHARTDKCGQSCAPTCSQTRAYPRSRPQVIPQLIARINHKYPEVQKACCRTICTYPLI